jgi:hypothetical protein
MNGYLHNQKVEKILQHINVLSDLTLEEVPEGSRFLLEIYFSELSKSHLKTQKYWTLAVDAALKVKSLESARGARAKQVRPKINTKIPSRKKLGIATVEHQIRKDGMHRTVVLTGGIQTTSCPQISLDKFVKRRPHPPSTMGSLRSNKRLQKPD